MCKVIVVGNQKGGVGKTTTTSNLGIGLAKQGKRVLLIDADKVKGAPNFAELWKKIEPIMSKGILVAHNAVFDMNVLRACLRDYGISWKPTAKYLCTVRIGRRVLPDMKHNLNVMCDHYGIALDHHQADSDSHACAEILLRYIESGIDVREYVKEYKL